MPSSRLYPRQRTTTYTKGDTIGNIVNPPITYGSIGMYNYIPLYVHAIGDNKVIIRSHSINGEDYYIESTIDTIGREVYTAAFDSSHVEIDVSDDEWVLTYIQRATEEAQRYLAEITYTLDLFPYGGWVLKTIDKKMGIWEREVPPAPGNTRVVLGVYLGVGYSKDGKVPDERTCICYVVLEDAQGGSIKVEQQGIIVSKGEVSDMFNTLLARGSILSVDMGNMLSDVRHPIYNSDMGGE